MVGFALRPGVIRGGVMVQPIRSRPRALPVAVILLGATGLAAPTAHADNKRLNDAVVSDVQSPASSGMHEPTSSPTTRSRWPPNGTPTTCSITETSTTTTGQTDPARRTAPTPRAFAAELPKPWRSTRRCRSAIVQLIKQWYYDPAAMAIMLDCANTAMGVWSVNGLDRTVVVAMYGQPAPRNR